MSRQITRESIRRSVQENSKLIAQNRVAIGEVERAIGKIVKRMDRIDNAAEQEEKIFGLLVRVLDAREPYTEGHNARTALLASVLAEAINFPPKKLEALHRAAGIHDIGKIAIPSAVLLKPSQLTEAEIRMVREHPRIGYDLIRPMRLDPIFEDVLLYHHENYDGSGYLSGLAGNAIPLCARIVHVCDVYEALTSSRPYRMALSPEHAMEFMRKQSQMFDPVLLKAFLKIERSVRSELERKRLQ